MTMKNILGPTQEWNLKLGEISHSANIVMLGHEIPIEIKKDNQLKTYAKGWEKWLSSTLMDWERSLHIHGSKSWAPISPLVPWPKRMLWNFPFYTWKGLHRIGGIMVLLIKGTKHNNLWWIYTKSHIDRFDQKDLERHFKELTQLKQQGSVEDYVAEFQKILVMVPGITEKRLTYLIIEGILESICGLVSTLDPTSLHAAN